MEIIKTINGDFEYEPVSFTNAKKLNLDVAKSNLLAVKKVLDHHGVGFGLMYGTLLGAVREGGFITHDEDTDLFVLEESRERLLGALFELGGAGFVVGRYDGKLLSITRADEYIDFYIFRKKGKSKRECSGYVVNFKHFLNTEEFYFLGERFNIPAHSKSLLKSLYGEDWETPKENSPASNYGIYLSFKMTVKKMSPTLFCILSWVKKTARI